MHIIAQNLNSYVSKLSCVAHKSTLDLRGFFYFYTEHIICFSSSSEVQYRNTILKILPQYTRLFIDTKQQKYLVQA